MSMVDKFMTGLIVVGAIVILFVGVMAVKESRDSFEWRMSGDCGYYENSRVNYIPVRCFEYFKLSTPVR